MSENDMGLTKEEIEYARTLLDGHMLYAEVRPLVPRLCSAALRSLELEKGMRELVRLKEIRDHVYFKTAWKNLTKEQQADGHAMLKDYEHCKPLAWAEARRLTERK